MKHKVYLLATLILSYANFSHAQNTESTIPYLVHKNGRHGFMVNGKPFLILGAQCNNSSAWPAMLPKVWSAMEKLHVNTLEIPIYWEQFEPQQGKYDYSVLDTIITQARERNLRLVLLWFATWENGSNHYMPQWMKLQPQKYPNMKNKEGIQIDAPSLNPEAMLEVELDKNQYLLAGYHSRVMFRPNGKNKGKHWEYLIVEEGQYVNGTFKADCILNGDQTDWGLNFAEPKVLRVSVYTRSN